VHTVRIKSTNKIIMTMYPEHMFFIL